MNQWTESLWGDEAFSALAVMKDWGQMLGVVVRDTAPPFFYILGWLWVRIFGSSEVALRSLTLICVLGAAVFAGLIVRKVGKTNLGGILTFLLSLGAPFIFPFAFEWRMYALLSLATLGSVYFFVCRRWIWFIVFSLMAIYTHHFGLFTVFGEALTFGILQFDWRKNRNLRGLWQGWWPFVVLGVLYLPGAYLTFLQTRRIQGSGFWLMAPTLGDVTNTLFRFFTGGVRREWRIPVALGGLCLLLVKNWRQVGREWLKLLIIFLSPVVLSVLVSVLVTPIFYDRYLLSVVMGMMILLVLGAERDYWPIIAALVLAFWWQSGNQFFNPSKKNFAEVAAYVNSGRAEEKVITIQRAEHHLWESKYYGIEGVAIYSPGGPLPLYVGTAQMEEGDVIYELPKVKRLGLITSEPIEKVELPGFELSKVKEFDKGLSFSWWE